MRASDSLDESIGYATTMTGRNIIRFLLAKLKPFDLTPEQWTVLKRLSEQDGMSQKELSERADKDQTTITRILDILERKELIRKAVNGEDRRSFRIHITDKGRRQKDELTPVIERFFENNMVVGISQEQLAIYRSVLSQINRNIAEHLDKNS